MRNEVEQNQQQPSELDECIWAVISEHGRLAVGLTYDHAADYMHRHFRQRYEKNGHRVHQGICVVTAAAAEKMNATY